MDAENPAELPGLRNLLSDARYYGDPDNFAAMEDHHGLIQSAIRVKEILEAHGIQ